MNYMTDIVNQFLHAEVMSYCYINFKVVNSFQELHFMKFHNLALILKFKMDCT